MRGIKLVEPAILHGDGGDSSAPNVSRKLIDESPDVIRYSLRTQGYPFQIGYSELNCITGGNSTLPTFTLYLVAASDKERSEWIRAIRRGNISVVNYFA